VRLKTIQRILIIGIRIGFYEQGAYELQKDLKHCKKGTHYDCVYFFIFTQTGLRDEFKNSRFKVQGSRTKDKGQRIKDKG